MKDNILIIGGLGHIGLPLGLIFANKGHDVCLFDNNQNNKEMILNFEKYEIDYDKKNIV